MKRLCFFLACVFCLGIFFACAPAEDPRVLNGEFARQIRQDYAEHFGDEFADPDSICLEIVWVREDRIALFVNWAGVEYGQAECSETVGEYVFRYPTLQKMLIYQSGNFFSVSEAFVKGVLQEEWLASLHSAYGEGNFVELTVAPAVPEPAVNYEISPAETKTYAWYESAEGALSDEKEAEIRNARGELSNWSYEDQARYTMEYFGGFRGTYAVRFSGFPVADRDLFPDGEQDELYGVDFSLYRDGAFYSPKQAVEQGALTVEELEVLYRNYRCAESYARTERILGDGRVDQRWREYSGQEADCRDLFRSYGQWGDSLLVLRGDNTPDSAPVQKIGSETFTSDTPFQLYVYNGLNFRTLQQAAEAGEISPRDLSVLAYFHQKLPEADAYTGYDFDFSWKTLTEAEKAFGSGEYSLHFTDYYGTYNGYTVFHGFAEGGAVEHLSVGNTVLRAVSDLQVYRDGTVEPLASAYASGKLTEEQMLKIASLHQARFPSYYREFGQITPLSDHLAGVMEEAWIASGNRTRLLPENGFYGIYDGYAFVFYPQPASDGLPWFTKYGEADLRYGQYFTVYGYQKGKFYTLSELYGVGALSKNTLNVLMQLHRQKFPDYYQVSAPTSPELSESLRTQVAALAEFPLDGVLYYGNFDGWEVFCRPTDEWALYYSLRRYPLEYYGNRAFLYGYRDGRFLLLAQAEKEGLLSDVAAQAVADYHNHRFFFYTLENSDRASGYLP